MTTLPNHLAHLDSDYEYGLSCIPGHKTLCAETRRSILDTGQWETRSPGLFQRIELYSAPVSHRDGPDTQGWYLCYYSLQYDVLRLKAGGVSLLAAVENEIILDPPNTTFSDLAENWTHGFVNTSEQLEALIAALHEDTGNYCGGKLPPNLCREWILIIAGEVRFYKRWRDAEAADTPLPPEAAVAS